MKPVAPDPHRAARDPVQAEWLNDLMRDVAINQDRQAFVALFNYYAPRIKAYLVRLGAKSQVAEELVQETLLVVWRRADSFDPRQASLSTWIFTIARNRWIDVVRRERHPEIDPEDLAMGSDPEPLPDRIYEQIQESEKVRSVLSQLPKEQAELIKLAYFDDMAHSKIVDVTGLPLGTIKSRLRLALQKLRRELKDWDPDDPSSS